MTSDALISAPRNRKKDFLYNMSPLMSAMSFKSWFRETPACSREEYYKNKCLEK